MTTDEIYQAFYADELARGFLHSHSYTGNPLPAVPRWRRWIFFAADDVLNTNAPRRNTSTGLRSRCVSTQSARLPQYRNDLGVRSG